MNVGMIGLGKLELPIASASFKTFGTSRIWGNESEVTSYRELTLKEISGDDRWRGRAWILDAGKLHANRQAR